MSSFTTDLFLTPLPDGKNWRLVKEFDYEVGAEGSGRVIRMPEGSITDFASIPRPLWGILPPWGKYGKACIVHDCLYRGGGITENGVTTPVDRGTADGILKEAMEVLGVGRLTRWTIYAGVRAGGHVAWTKGHAGV